MPPNGNARVSSSIQKIEIQRARLEAAGCEAMRTETVSGASREDRVELLNILDFRRNGDELDGRSLYRLSIELAQGTVAFRRQVNARLLLKWASAVCMSLSWSAGMPRTPVRSSRSSIIWSGARSIAGRCLPARWKCG